MPANIRIVYSKEYAVDIGNHVFPTSKYRQIRDRLSKESRFRNRVHFITPKPASAEDVLLVHDKVYVDKLAHGTLSRDEILRLELPYSKELFNSSLVCCGGTMAACRIAIEDKIGIHIGGGFHHAFPDHGEGFCVLNDIAVGIRRVMADGLVKRAVVVDCDLHQGNGTAAIFAKDPDVFTFSIHQENNYPFFKPASRIDVGLRDWASDREYLEALTHHVPKIVSDFKPGLIVYVAGADPYKEDKIGGLALTKEGLRQRDELVFHQALHFGVPIAVVLAGGYAVREEDTVDIHYQTIISGLQIFDSGKRG